MKPNFSEYTRRLALKMQNGYCMVVGCMNKATDFHHRFSNTKLNNKKFPLFVQSIFNCFPICRKCHDDYGNFEYIKITDSQAECYEEWLEKFQSNAFEIAKDNI